MGVGQVQKGFLNTTQPFGISFQKVVPFGLTNSPTVFQAPVNHSLCDFANIFVFFYLDDIQIYSKEFQQHTHHVKAIL